MDVLGVLLLEPSGRFYLRELASKAELSVGNVRRELQALLESGIVTKEVRGRQTYYSIDEQCPIIPELRSIFVKTTGVVDVIKVSLELLWDRISLAFVYGSFAKGSQTSKSDVDLLVIGEASFKDIVGALRHAQDRLGREINPTVYTQDEFAGKVRDGDRFINSILNEPKVFVIGDQSGLGRLA